jgi:hypothetical protein
MGRVRFSTLPILKPFASKESGYRQRGPDFCSCPLKTTTFCFLYRGRPERPDAELDVQLD